MARKLNVPPATVMQLLRAAHDIADPKDILGPCDIDLPSTWLITYQFKFLSALAFTQAGATVLPQIENEEIIIAGRQLSDELDKCKRIGAYPHFYLFFPLLTYILNSHVLGKEIHIYGLIKHCAAFRALYSPAAIEWATELPALHRCLVNDKAARSQSGHPLIFWRPKSYVSRCIFVLFLSFYWPPPPTRGAG